MRLDGFFPFVSGARTYAKARAIRLEGSRVSGAAILNRSRFGLPIVRLVETRFAREKGDVHFRREREGKIRFGREITIDIACLIARGQNVFTEHPV